MVAPEENTAFNLVHLKTPLPDPRKKCLFCGKENHLISFKKQTICFTCLKSIRQLYIEGYFCQNG
ncbi:hypothetical protein Sgly_0627 [Syntrophobotulus glycolicus DSM 8271]|uniref:Uncharacterized protein n=1 Tax=Syntrophobotulus glycolicus (strain DSM 8271 / FlGlyR) TaxID=645991 RepID=F0SZX8_SYNGF|nr:hypothetical protein Sgly_0627 [Syntrophobotulus glycolicus DSM 8271]